MSIMSRYAPATRSGAAAAVSASADAATPQAPRKRSLLDSLPKAPATDEVNLPSPVQPLNPLSLNVAVLGAPNAGKSTLVNALVGAKITAVSHKSQTTRSNLYGILTEDSTQLVFVDTPGIVPIAKQKTVIRDIVTGAWSATWEADLALMVLDAARGPQSLEDSTVGHIFKQLEKVRDGESKPCVLALSKADMVSKDDTLRLADHVNQYGLFSDIFVVSAQKGMNLDGLKRFLLGKALPRPWEYHADILAGQSRLATAEEVIREKLFQRFNKELPYEVRQSNRSWSTLPNGDIVVEQLLLVSKMSQKAVLIGKGGIALKFVGMASSQDLTSIFGCKVHVYLRVKCEQEE
jgi:GTP-binding protein Era